MIGFRSGRLVVLSRAPSLNKRAMWLCRCDCGTELIRMGKYLRRGEVKSCGCLNRQGISGPANFRHGHSVRLKGISATLRIWYGMRDRCYNSKSGKWPRYGGRGIKVCPRWESFANFLSDMGERPDRTSIDRINNDGDYEPGNCRWASAEKQASNTSRNRWITYKGRCLTLSQWARELGRSVSGLHVRLRCKPIDKAMIPLLKPNHHIL